MAGLNLGGATHVRFAPTTFGNSQFAPPSHIFCMQPRMGRDPSRPIWDMAIEWLVAQGVMYMLPVVKFATEVIATSITQYLGASRVPLCSILSFLTFFAPLTSHSSVLLSTHALNIRTMQLFMYMYMRVTIVTSVHNSLTTLLNCQ